MTDPQVFVVQSVPYKKAGIMTAILCRSLRLGLRFFLASMQRPLLQTSEVAQGAESVFCSKVFGKGSQLCACVRGYVWVSPVGTLQCSFVGLGGEARVLAGHSKVTLPPRWSLT